MSPIMRVAPSLFLLLAGLVSGCTSEPFVDLGTSVTVQKTIPLLTGNFSVCHSDQTPWSEVTALAEEQCAARGLKSVMLESLRWQCRAVSPHRATFSCVDPSMRNPDGSYVNPRDRAAVSAWEKRTGKKAPAYAAPQSPVNSTPAAPVPGAASGSTAVPPPPASALPVLTPEGIAGKPAIPVQPPRIDSLPPAPAPAPADGGFKLPVGSWGDSFQE